MRGTARDPDQPQAGVRAIQYKGIEITVVQTANPTGFKWTVHLDTERVQTGDSPLRLAAIASAQNAIDKAARYLPKREIKPPQ